MTATQPEDQRVPIPLGSLLTAQVEASTVDDTVWVVVFVDDRPEWRAESDRVPRNGNPGMELTLQARDLLLERVRLVEVGTG